MKIFVTGATGYIGTNLAHTLAGMGNEVHAIVRSGKAKELLQHPNIMLFKGDILEKESLLLAMTGCRQVYHTAAKVGVWAKDPSLFYKVNVEGTKNVLDAALQSGIEKFVFTSTCGVIGSSLYEPLNEQDPLNTSFALEYDLSKKIAEEMVFQYAGKGMNTIIVCPSKVYGPGNISHSLTANAVINMFLKKRVAFIPWPGTYKVCFAFIDDIVKGHLLAMEKGKTGNKYILGGINTSYQQFFNSIRCISHCNGRIIQLSKESIRRWAVLELLSYKITSIQPHFTVKSSAYIFNNYIFSSEKATRELGYKITPLDEGLKKTIWFLKGQKK